MFINIELSINGHVACSCEFSTSASEQNRTARVCWVLTTYFEWINDLRSQISRF